MAEELQFEKALEKLEKIVQDLESGDSKLDEALKKYEEGVKLSRQCRMQLEKAEKKIEVLSRSLDGSLKKEPFDCEEIRDEAAPKAAGAKNRKKKIPEEAGGAEDILI